MISRRSRCVAISPRQAVCMRFGKIADELGGERRIVDHVAGDEIAGEGKLGVGEEHADFARVSGLPAARRSASADIVGKRFDARGRAGRGSRAPASGAADGRNPRSRAARRARSRAAAGSCCAAPAPRRRRSCAASRRFRRARSSLPARTALPSAILILTSTSEVLTPAELSIASELQRPPARPNSIRAALASWRDWRPRRRRARGAPPP